MGTDRLPRKALITGGSSGIGKSIVHSFSQAGFEVYNVDINPPDDNVGTFFSVDLISPKKIDSFVHKVTTNGESPDILVCNAGRGVHEKLTEGDPDVWENIFRLNVFIRSKN